MKRLWLLFAQTVTILVAVYFIVATLQPGWLHRASVPGARVSVIEAPPPTASTAPATPGSVPAHDSLSAAARRAAPAVVSITASKSARHDELMNDPWFRFFFGNQGGQPQVGLGSGVIVSPEGYVLTNNHVIEGADKIEVALNDGRRVPGKVIGTDPDTDVAVLKISLARLPVITLGNSAALQVGDRVLAIGNPFGVGQTVTSGIVSALGRSQLGINTFEDFIQTDAAINPGNSGGALVDINGNLEGINTAIYSRSGGSMGIGFAIPVSVARQVLEAIVRDGKVTRGWIGVEPTDLTPELAQTFGIKAEYGVIITGVLQSGPAANAGIRPGDVITSVDGHKTSNTQELLSTVAALKPGESAHFTLQRGSKSIALNVTPGTRPRNAAAQRVVPMPSPGDSGGDTGDE
ncbi:MAG: trypsin-like peptidase domain-containing protein [Burkholderiaceae bacterium]|jgi:Do/DeqQ family serine protease|nr:trypsin-like peptidase domain-containing protein [Burkholderiaceae bacterium]